MDNTETAKPQRIPTRDLRPGDRVSSTRVPDGVVVSTRMMTAEELEVDPNLSGDDWMVVSYRDPHFPADHDYLEVAAPGRRWRVTARGQEPQTETDPEPEPETDPEPEPEPEIEPEIAEQLARTALRLADDIDQLTADNAISIDSWDIGPLWEGTDPDAWRESIERRTPMRRLDWGPQIAAWLRTIPDTIRDMPALRSRYADMTGHDREGMLYELCGGELTDPVDAEEYLRQHVLVDADMDMIVFRSSTDSEEIRQGGDPRGAGYYWWQAWRAYVQEALGEQAPYSLHHTMLTLTAAQDRVGPSAGEDELLRECADAADTARTATALRDDRIRAAITAKKPVERIARATGLTRSRVYQIRDGRR